MKLCTASETLSFIRGLEEKTAEYFKQVSEKYGQDQELWAWLAKENAKYVTQVQRAYQSVITDAIEGCYAFNLESDEHAIEAQLPQGASYAEAVKKALNIEEQMINLYEVAAEQSASLLADVPRNFKIVVKKRKNRLPKLKELG